MTEKSNELGALLQEMDVLQGYSEECQSGTEKKEHGNVDVRINSEKTDDMGKIKNQDDERLLSSTMNVVHLERNNHSRNIVEITNAAYVEIIRRRSYERFKKDLQAIFRNYRPNVSNGEERNCWETLHFQSIMEEFHFCLKMEESKRHKKAIVDPILISPTLLFNEGPLVVEILKSIISFHWCRQWRKQKKNPSNIENKEICEPLIDLGDQSCIPSFLSRFIENKLIKQIHVAIMEAQKYFKKYKYDQTKQQESKKTPKIKHDVLDKNGSTTSQKSVTYHGLTLYINNEHYDRLRRRFEHNTKCDSNLSFPEALFTVLCRYDMLAGAGLQSSLPSKVFEILFDQYNCCMESFASPLNSQYDKFCSAFKDIDSYFNSCGSFFDYNFSRHNEGEGGCFQANPPFIPHFIHKMIEFIEVHMEKSTKTESPLMFIIFIPKWENTSCYLRVKNSSFCEFQCHFSQSEDTHYYCEGTQHRRKKRYRIASFDTSIFFIMNSKAKEKWNVDDGIVKQLRNAFQNNVNSPQSKILEEHEDKLPVENKINKSQPPMSKSNAGKIIKSSGLSLKRKTNMLNPSSTTTGEKQNIKNCKNLKSKRRKNGKGAKFNFVSTDRERSNQMTILSKLDIKE